MKRAHNLRSNSMIDGSILTEYTQDIINLKIEGKQKLKPGIVIDDINQSSANVGE